MNNLNILYAFIGGAVVGAGAAMLFAPEKEIGRASCRERV